MCAKCHPDRLRCGSTRAKNLFWSKNRERPRLGRHKIILSITRAKAEIHATQQRLSVRRIALLFETGATRWSFRQKTGAQDADVQFVIEHIRRITAHTKQLMLFIAKFQNI